MESKIHICQNEIAAPETTDAQGGYFSWLMLKLRPIWRIARDVLRGYLMGQPPDESRPRKGCC